MAVTILMPALSPTMTEGTLARWLKNEGDAINPGDIIAEIETDKATMEVDAVDGGILAKILVPGGTEGVAVNNVIAVIKEDGDDDSDVEQIIAKASDHDAPSAQDSKVVDDEIDNGSKRADIATEIKANDAASNQGVRVKASPLAKKIAAKHDVDISQIEGTGPRARIIKSDVLAFVENGIDASRSSVARESVINNVGGQRKDANSVEEGVANRENITVSEASGMRKVIAKRLLESKQNIPHFYISARCEVSKMLEIRKMLNDKAPKDQDGKPQYKISVNDMIVKAASMALKAMPEVNAYWDDGKIIQLHDVDISIAIAVDGGIFTPVLRNAHHKSLTEISLSVRDFAKRAKEGKLTMQELEGGGLSISNLGMYNVDQFNAIINPPQSAILAIGATKKEPVVLADDSLGVGNIMNVTLSCDHRIVDGAVAAIFLQHFQSYLYDPIMMLV